MGKIGLWYIHGNEHEYLYPSLATQAPYVDYVGILDNTPPELADPAKTELTVRNICNGTTVIYKHTMEFGYGFEEATEYGYFNEVNARNAAADLIKDKVDYLVQCDADEWYSPPFFEWIHSDGYRHTAHLYEVLWLPTGRYKITQWKHDRGIPSKNWLGYAYNADTGFLSGFVNKSMHCVPKYSSPQLNLDNFWHNHVRNCMGRKCSWKPGMALEGGEYRFNTDMLFHGEWPEPYKGLIAGL